MKLITRVVLSCCVRIRSILSGFVWLLAGSAAFSQTAANGPYYATPSWNQTLPSSSRFVVLTNFNSEAVLDRETGLVWERQPSDEFYYANTYLSGLFETPLIDAPH